MGDFDAHIDRQAEFVDEHHDVLDTFQELQAMRLDSCGCNQVNYAGKLLLELAASGPLILTTGRGRGDTGQASYVGYGKNLSSRPGHFLVTPELFRNIHSCTVQAAGDCISDHCGVATCFLMRKCGKLENADLRANTNKVHQHNCKH